MDSLLRVKPPPGGLPGEIEENGEYGIVARAPTYGTSDAGRKFWKSVRAECAKAGR